MPKSKRTFSWMNPKLEVRNSGSYGKGLFAKEDIVKGELLSVFGGYVITRIEEEQLPEDFNDNGVMISEELVLSKIDREELEPADYINHSCSPNAGFKGQIFMVAMQKIRGGGVEITFDYGMVLHKTKGAKSYSLVCKCGSKNCRKVITDNDWKIPELQRKYVGYFQWYLQDKIDRLKKRHGNRKKH